MANWQDFSTTQDGLQPKPSTIAAAATIAPTSLITFLSGTTQVASITPPLDGPHVLILIFTNASPGATLTSGNIALATTTVQNKALLMTYDPVSAKYYPSY